MILEAKSISAGYGGDPVIRNISIRIETGRIVGVLGPNGSGKTTLLRALSGLIPFTGETLRVDDRDLSSFSPRKRARLIAWVHQRETSPFAFTVRQWVEMGRFCHTGYISPASDRDLAAVDGALSTCNLQSLAERPLLHLSGGEAQRAHIARALAQDAGMLFLDEPLTHLDLRYQDEIYHILRKLARQDQRALLCVLHDLDFAAAFCDEVLCLKNGQTFASGNADEVLTPETLSRLYDVRIIQKDRSLAPSFTRTTRKDLRDE